MDKIVVVGGGGHAKVIISILKKLDKHTIFGYTDKIDKGNILEIPYLGNDNILENLANKKNIKNVVIGVGQIASNTTRLSIYNKLSDLGFSFPTIISPNATINEEVSIGKGTVVMDGVVINSGSEIGNFSIINTNSSIDHDCRIGNFVHIAPGVTLSGGVSVGDYTFIGAGSVVIQNISIKGHCKIGAGAVVNKDIITKGTYIGKPAKKIK